jgi:hypothetical protein
MEQAMKEALKLALEALQWSKPHKDAVITHSEAITAIVAALEQPTSGDYALGYAEGFNDACKPAQPVQEPWCMKMNRCTTKCEDCPDEPAQRPWVGLTEAQFLEATRLAENGNYLVAFVRIQEWLKEKNT